MRKLYARQYEEAVYLKTDKPNHLISVSLGWHNFYSFKLPLLGFFYTLKKNI